MAYSYAIYIYTMMLCKREAGAKYALYTTGTNTPIGSKK